MNVPTCIKPVIFLIAGLYIAQPAMAQDANLEAEAVAAQAAATYAFQVKQCAELAGDIPGEVVDEVTSRLAATRQFFIGAEYTFDLHFSLQWQRAEAGEIATNTNEEICLPIILHLRHLAKYGFQN